MKMFVGIVVTKYNNNVYTGETREAVIDEIHEYVEAWWEIETSDPGSEDETIAMPEDKEEAIKMYFSLMKGKERFMIEELEPK